MEERKPLGIPHDNKTRTTSASGRPARYFVAMLVIVVGAAFYLAIANAIVHPASSSGLEPTAVPNLFVRAAKLDLGKVPQESVAHSHFELINSGSTPLQLLTIVSDCGCTQAQLPTTTLDPHGSIEIPVSFSAGTPAIAEFKHRLLLRVGSSNSVHDVWLEIHGVIEPLKTVLPFPTVLDFGNLAAGQRKTISLYLRGTSKTLAAIPDHIQVDGPTTILPVKYLAGDDSELSCKRINVEFCCRDVQGQEVALHFIDARGMETPVIVPLRWTATGGVVAVPARLLLVGRADLPASGSFALLPVQGSEVVIANCSSDLPLQVRVIREGTSIRCQAQTAGGALVSSNRSGKIVVKFSEPPGELSIPTVMAPLENSSQALR